MDAATLIAKYGKAVTLRRQSAAGAYVNRIYQQGDYAADVPIRMSIQPINGEELVQLQDGDRTMEFARGYTATELFTSTHNPSKKADLIITGAGVKYQVHKVEPWESNNNNIVPYWKVILARVNP